MQVFEGASANQVWLKAAGALRVQQGQASQSSRAGDTIEIVPACFAISDPRNRWVISREPALSIAFALVEVIGIMNGRQDSGYLNWINPALPRYAGKGPTFHGAYGDRLRQHFQFDQLKRAADALTASPDSRQVVLQIWDAEVDLPTSDGKARAEDIPCNICSMLKVRDRKLHWTQIIRSNDLFRGVPYNFVQFTTLQEILSGWLDIDVGGYTHVADSLHVYLRDAGRMFAHATLAEASNTDSLAAPYDKGQGYWTELNQCVDELSCAVTSTDIERIVTSRVMPKGYTNILRIIAADAARRSGDVDLAHELARQCDNPVLQICWKRWYDRQQQRACSVTQQ
jgi:thymidylate synthase